MHVTLFCSWVNQIKARKDITASWGLCAALTTALWKQRDKRQHMKYPACRLAVVCLALLFCTDNENRFCFCLYSYLCCARTMCWHLWKMSDVNSLFRPKYCYEPACMYSTACLCCSTDILSWASRYRKVTNSSDIHSGWYEEPGKAWLMFFTILDLPCHTAQ